MRTMAVLCLMVAAMVVLGVTIINCKSGALAIIEELIEERRSEDAATERVRELAEAFRNLCPGEPLNPLDSARIGKKLQQRGLYTKVIPSKDPEIMRKIRAQGFVDVPALVREEAVEHILDLIEALPEELTDEHIKTLQDAVQEGKIRSYLENTALWHRVDVSWQPKLTPARPLCGGSAWISRRNCFTVLRF